MAEQPQPPIILSSSDILGIIQRSLMELHSYCGQTPDNVDPQVCMAVLERTAGFVGRLVHQVGAANDKPDEARVN